MTGILKSQAGYRSVLNTSVFAGVPFVPENTDLGSYAFVPWVRNGLATAIAGAPVDGRALVPVSFDIKAIPPDATPPFPEETRTVARKLALRGPGDVIGIDQAQIIRRAPAPNVALSDDSLLALIEFDRPDLPWLHSPFVEDGNRLKPWITLVVCREDRATLSSGSGGRPDQLTTHLSELQPLDDAWAWAHAQVLGVAAGGSTVADRLNDAHADQNLSRLICPRRLRAGSSYIACVVPTFEIGAKAGLGLGGGSVDAPAWSAGNPDTEVLLPVYTSWRFSIGESATFEKLARRLVPVSAPWQIGRRAIDLRTPRGGVSDDLVSPGGVQLLDCALQSLTPPPPAEPQPAEWTQARTEELRGRVQVDTGDPELPRVGPRFYARFQRGSVTIPGGNPISKESDWFTAINLRPLDRIAAGLGARVVNRDQDRLMQAAWLQVGEIKKANQSIDRIRLSRYVAEALVAKTLAKLPMAALTATTAQVHGKIALPTTTRTVWSEIGTSAMPRVATMMAFRRAVVSGPVARTATKGATLSARRDLAGLIETGSNLRDLRLSYADPIGIGALTVAAAQTFPIELLGKALNVDQSVAQAVSVRKFGGTTISSQIGQPRTAWTIADTRTSPALVTLQQARLDTLDKAMRSVATLSPGLQEALGAQFAVLAQRAPSLADTANVRISSLDQSLGKAFKPIALVARPVARPIGRRGAVPAAATRAERFSNFGALQVPTGAAVAVRTATNAVLANTISDLVQGIGIVDMPTTPVSVAPSVTREILLAAIDPAPLATRALIARLGTVPSWLPHGWFDDLQLKPIMKAPRFDVPMWSALKEYDQEWLIPNLGLVDQTDFVTMLFDNPRFTEAYLVGLSDEMGRELLWRDYPTDQRGTYFYRMWSENSDDLKQQIARFAPGKLGSHLVGGEDPRVVMLIRGAVVKRHPEAIFVAVQRNGDKFSAPPSTGKGAILFHAALNSDTMLVGFDLKKPDVESGDWWFLLAEHPTAPQFGLDAPPGADLPLLVGGQSVSIDNLTWGQLPMRGDFLNAAATGPTVTEADGTPSWASDAAVAARILLQNPARAAFNGKALLDGML